MIYNMKKIKESKLISFIIIAIVYILATILQVILFNSLNIDNLYLKILIIDVVATIFVFIFSIEKSSNDAIINRAEYLLE